MSTTANGKGYAKVILFGEHFVVYGYPAIASAIDRYVEVKADKIKDSEDLVFDDKIFEKKTSMKEEPEHYLVKLVKSMFEKEEFVKLKGIKFVVSGNASPKAGMGYSAALSVAFARALNQLFDLDWKDEKINETALLGENFTHGEASGIDNARATYGSAIWFEKAEGEKKEVTRKLPLGKSLLCLLVDTGKKRDTKEAVAAVKTFKEKNSKQFDKLCAEYKTLAGKVKKELQYGGIEQLGKLMNQNNELLKQLGLSTPEIEQIIKFAIYENVFGAKITGAGMGGNVLILCMNAAQQEKLIAAYETKGYKAIKVKMS